MKKKVASDIEDRFNNTSSHIEVREGHLETVKYAYYHTPNLQIQRVKRSWRWTGEFNAPEDGPVSSETCWANICDE